MAKVGRNDPCPCGSGKKYKFCCGDQKIIPFPGGGPIGPDFNPEVPAATVGSLSINELQDALDELMERSSVRPEDDFLGLSPSIMHDILYSKFEDNTHIVAFVPEIIEEESSVVPLLRQSLYFLDSLKELQPLKSTQKGNLPRSFVQQLYEHAVQEFLLYDDLYPQKESDVREIEKLRYVLTYSGLIKKAHQTFSLTKSAEQLLVNSNYSGIYQKIFHGSAIKLAWFSEDAFPEYRIIQDALIFDLYLVHKLAKNYISAHRLGEAFVKAFPYALSESDGYGNPEDQLISCFLVRFIERFAVPMGLLSPNPSATGSERITSTAVEYRSTPLFHRIFKWNVGR